MDKSGSRTEGSGGGEEETAGSMELRSYRPFSYLSSSSSSRRSPSPVKSRWSPPPPAAYTTMTMNTDDDIPSYDAAVAYDTLLLQQPDQSLAERESFRPPPSSSVDGMRQGAERGNGDVSQLPSARYTNGQNHLQPPVPSPSLVDSSSTQQQGDNDAGKKGKGKTVEVMVDTPKPVRTGNSKKDKRCGGMSEEEKARNVAIVLSIFVTVFFNLPFGCIALVISCCTSATSKSRLSRYCLRLSIGISFTGIVVTMVVIIVLFYNFFYSVQVEVEPPIQSQAQPLMP